MRWVFGTIALGVSLFCNPNMVTAQDNVDLERLRGLIAKYLAEAEHDPELAGECKDMFMQAIPCLTSRHASRWSYVETLRGGSSAWIVRYSDGRVYVYVNRSAVGGGGNDDPRLLAAVLNESHDWCRGPYMPADESAYDDLVFRCFGLKR